MAHLSLITLPIVEFFTTRRVLLVVFLMVLAATAGALVFQSQGPENLASNAAAKAEMIERWRKGELIVLVRHAERCDRSDMPCLSSPEGITVRGRVSAQGLGRSLEGLGLSNADIMSSSQVRAEQTAEAMFGSKGAILKQGWLFNCRGEMMQQAVRHKVPHRNLVLATHSECIKDLELTANISDPDTPAYISSLFVVFDGGAPALLGYLDGDQWGDVVSVN